METFEFILTPIKNEYCFNCYAKSECELQKYVASCERFPIGPPVKREDDLYQQTLQQIYDYLTSPQFQEDCKKLNIL